MSIILDHKDPAREACDSSPQITGIPALEAIADARIALEMQRDLDNAVRYAKTFDIFLNKLTGGPGK